MYIFLIKDEKLLKNIMKFEKSSATLSRKKFNDKYLYIKVKSYKVLSVYRKNKNYCHQVLTEECKYFVKKRRLTL